MECSWLHNLSAYPLAVYRPWRVIMGPTEYCTTIMLPKQSQSLPRISLSEPNQAFRIVDFLGCSPNENSSWYREQREGTDLTISRSFPVVWCPGFMFMTPSFTRVSITFSNQRFSNCSPAVGVGFVKLSSDSFCRNRVFKMSIQFCCHLCCSSSWFFETILNIRRSLSVSVDFGPLFLVVNVFFPWFVYAYINLETVAPDAPNNVAVHVFVSDAPAKRPPTIFPLSKSDKSIIFLFFHTDCRSTQSLMHWHEHYRV
jgi:hypothetical protein